MGRVEVDMYTANSNEGTKLQDRDTNHVYKHEAGRERVSNSFLLEVGRRGRKASCLPALVLQA